MTAINDILVHDGQLGERLNQAVHQSRRGEFALLLSMLATDQSAAAEQASNTAPTEEALLRRELQLPEPAPLQDFSETGRAAEFRATLDSDGLSQIRLMQSLRPSPLTTKPTLGQTIPSDVMANCDLITQFRHMAKQEQTAFAAVA